MRSSEKDILMVILEKVNVMESRLQEMESVVSKSSAAMMQN